MKSIYSLIAGSIIAAGMLFASAMPAHAQFGQIVNGPPVPATCLGANTLLQDGANGITYSCGTPRVPQAFETSLYEVTAATAVTSVTTAQTAATIVLPAGTLNQALRILRVCGYGIYTSPGTTAPTLTLSMQTGGVTQVSVTSGAMSTTASTNMPFSFCYDLTTVTTGATGTMEAHGNLNINLTANTPAGLESTYDDVNTAPSAATNLITATNVLVQVAASSSVSSVQIRQLTAEIVN